MLAKTKTIAFYCIVCLFPLTIVALLGEVYLRSTGKYQTWSELNRGKYISPYQSRDSWYHTLSPNSRGTYSQFEFSFDRSANSLGLRGQEWTEKKPRGAKRILTLGDSFTEGMGAELKDSYPKILERDLKNEGYDVEVLNAGVAGSDPFFQYVLLRDKLIRFSPDIVLIMINNTDIDDIAIRGGLERFREDGTVAPRRQSRVEPLYEHLFLFRFFHHEIWNSNSLFVTYKEMKLLQEQSTQKIVDAITHIQDLGKEERFDLLVIIQPLSHEFERARSPMPTVARLLKEHSINVLDVTPLMIEEIGSAQSIDKFIWEKDQHFNAAGYAMLAELVSKTLLERNMLQ